MFYPFNSKTFPGPHLNFHGYKRILIKDTLVACSKIVKQGQTGREALHHTTRCWDALPTYHCAFLLSLPSKVRCSDGGGTLHCKSPPPKAYPLDGTSLRTCHITCKPMAGNNLFHSYLIQVKLKKKIKGVSGGGSGPILFNFVSPRLCACKGLGICWLGGWVTLIHKIIILSEGRDSVNFVYVVWNQDHISPNPLLYPFLVHFFISQYFICRFVCPSLFQWTQSSLRDYVFGRFISRNIHWGGSHLFPAREKQGCLFSFLEEKTQEELLLFLPSFPHSCPGCLLYWEMWEKKSHVLDSAPSTSPYGPACPQKPVFSVILVG